MPNAQHLNFRSLLRYGAAKLQKAPKYRNFSP